MRLSLLKILEESLSWLYGASYVNRVLLFVSFMVVHRISVFILQGPLVQLSVAFVVNFLEVLKGFLLRILGRPWTYSFNQIGTPKAVCR